ncbi:unnamed protein product [Mytilus edulis]|uniref:Novel STAND NTPase 3 domain-containing protein n=1 Tax=Mytilus edulis TaxID=6550 RepID=A0A8S3VBK9_MYTED|nr:unnamed protein product [Mytilus edulis]
MTARFYIIKGIHGSKIQEWEHSCENIVETKAILNLKDLIYKNEIVSITGPPGCGKSAASQCVAFYLQNHRGYHIIPAYYPSEIVQYRNPEQKQVFVYDDVCGKYEIEIHSVNDWIKLSPDILKVLTPNGVKVLATCRSNISKNKQFERIKIFSKVQCDLHSHENNLTTDERILIANKILGKEDVDILKEHKLLDKYVMFPLLCRFYSRKPTGSLTAFFSRPIDVIKEDLESLKDADDQTSYATLALCVLCNNCIKTDMLCSSSSIKSILEELADSCTLRHVFSLQVVKSQLDMLTDSYVEKSNDTYKIIHDKIFDILVSFYGEHMFDLSRKLLSIRTSSPLYAATVTGNLQLVKLLCDHGAKTCESDLFKNSPLHVAVFYGHTEIAQYLIKHNAYINCQNKEDETPLFIASKNGNEEIVELLLQHNANVNLCNIDGISPLLIACFWSYHNVAKLLIHYRADVNLCGNRDDSPLFISCLKGDVELVSLFLENNICINIRTKFSLKRMPSLDVHRRVEFLSRFTFRDMLSMPFFCSESMEEQQFGCVTPLYIACSIGYTDVVDMLLVKGADVNICNKNHESSLFTAAERGHSEIVKLLLDCNVNPKYM